MENDQVTGDCCGRHDAGSSKKCGDGRRRNNLLLYCSTALFAHLFYLRP